MAANHGIMAANFIEMTANQVLSPAPEVSFLRSREIFHQKKNCFTLGAGSLSVCSKGHETIGMGEGAGWQRSFRQTSWCCEPSHRYRYFGQAFFSGNRLLYITTLLLVFCPLDILPKISKWVNFIKIFWLKKKMVLVSFPVLENSER
jgi:hypothetical protein